MPGTRFRQNGPVAVTQVMLDDYRRAVQELQEAVEALSAEGDWDLLYERVRLAQGRCEETLSALNLARGRA